MGLGDEFGDADAGEDEESAGELAGAEALADEEPGGEPGEDRFEGHDEGGVGGREDGLRPGLDGEGRSGGDDGRDGEGDDEAGGEVDGWVLDEGETGGHEESAEADLKDGERAEVDFWRCVAECEAVKSEADGAAEGEEVAEIDGGEIREEAGACGLRGEEEDSGEGEDCSEPGIPAAELAPGGRRNGIAEKSGTRTTTIPVMKADFEGVVRASPVVWNW